MNLFSTSINVHKASVRVVLLVLMLWGSLAVFGCSLVEPKPSSPDSAAVRPESSETASVPRTTSVPIEGLSPQKPKYSNIEVVWAVPAEPVEGFVIYYGLSRDNLEFKVRVAAESLEQTQDNERGLVYRYVVRDVAADKPVYLAISAYSGDKASPLSEIREIAAQ